MAEISNKISSVPTIAVKTDNTDKKVTNKENIPTNTPIKSDIVEISEQEKNNLQENEKGLFANIKKSLRDGVVCGSLAYTGGSIANHFKDKVTKTNVKEGKSAKFPIKNLAIAIGLLSAAASLWTAQTKENIAETAQRRLRNFH